MAVLGAATTAYASDTQTQADGTYFVAQADGSVRHAPSGLVCPAQIGAFVRRDMTVIDPTDGGIDIDCRFFAAKSWVSAFDTKYQNMTLDSVFDGYLKGAKDNDGVDHDLPAPGAVTSSLPVRSGFWQARDGKLQGMWVAAKGDWYLELRVTYVAGDEAGVTAVAQQILDLAASR
jgi:hypothetical protein